MCELEVQMMIPFVVIFLTSIGSFSIYGQTSYIAKRYFDKHGSLLVEREFNNFMENEIIPLGLLHELLTDKNLVLPTLSDLHRNINGEGSHRRLSSSMRLTLQPELSARSCEAIIIERLPSGVFADPFELQHLVQRGVFNDAAVFGDTNLELPSFQSSRSVVEIHMSITPKVFSQYDHDWEVNLEPLGHGFSRVEFGQPDLFMCCGLEGNGRNRSCLLLPANHISGDKVSPVVWEIPCGIKAHAGVVSAVTFGFASVTALLIVLTAICYSDVEAS